MKNKKILLVIGGGIAAYKSLDLIRQLRAENVVVHCVMTPAAGHFVTPLSVAALSENPVHEEFFSPNQENQFGHIQLARWADFIVVAPATADLMARMATGQADDLATTVLLATTAPILLAPSMNVKMWEHPATQRNVALLKADGVSVIGPASGVLACGEEGAGRMAPTREIAQAIEQHFKDRGALKGMRALVTSGPTREPIDPVRFIGNHSSGKQGHAIASALANAGADVTLVSGKVSLEDPDGVKVVKIETALEMKAAVENAGQMDIVICAAAVADWRIANPLASKTKKQEGTAPPTLELVENPDILRFVSTEMTPRPRLVIGFAAETDNVLENGRQKRVRKGCDWIVLNDVSRLQTTFGSDQNQVVLVGEEFEEQWPLMTKAVLADRLVNKVIANLNIQGS